MIFIAALFVLLGFLIKDFKMYFLIAGYNTMSAKDKAKIDIAGIAILFKNVMLCMSGVLVMGCFVELILKIDIEDHVIVGSVFPGTLYLIIRSNSGKYLIHPENPEK